MIKKEEEEIELAIRKLVNQAAEEIPHMKLVQIRAKLRALAWVLGKVEGEL